MDRILQKQWNVWNHLKSLLLKKNGETFVKSSHCEEIKVSGAIFSRSYVTSSPQEIVDDLTAALEQFRLIANDLGEATAKSVPE